MNSSQLNNLTPKCALLIDAIKQHWHLIEGKYLHHLQISVSIDNDTSANSLSELIRKLINSKQSINCIDNRSFFNSSFDGGCYLTTVRQDFPESEIFAVYDLLCLTEKQHLDSVMEGLHRRVKKIFPENHVNLISSIELSSKERFENLMATTFNKVSNIKLEGERFKNLDKHQRRWVMEVVGKDIREFGQFYLMVHQQYNL